MRTRLSSHEDTGDDDDDHDDGDDDDDDDEEEEEKDLQRFMDSFFAHIFFITSPFFVG